MGLTRRVTQELGRMLLSVVGAMGIIAVACAALFVTSAPKWVSLVVQPVSLLLIPGVGLSMLFTKSHDYSEMEILRGALLFYGLLLFGLLWWRNRQHAMGRR